jgi:hypothetical protein
MLKPVITVFGATGAQGGGLARGVTRKPDGAAARELQAA